MGYLAMSIGDDTAAAVHRPDQSVDPEIFETPATLSFGEDGTVSLGAPSAAENVSRFASRIGQGVDGYVAEDLVAHAANCLVSMVTAKHGGVVPATALTYPRTWGPEELALLRTALDHTGLHGVRLVSENRAMFEFDSVSSSDVEVSTAVSLAVGALAVLEESDVAEGDSFDTDAIPVVTEQKALAFSEAMSAAPSETPDDPERTRRKPLLVVTGIAVAVILASVGIAAAFGTFDDGAEVSPPAITDALLPTTTQAPTTVSSAVAPFPTAPPAEPESTPETTESPSAEVTPEVAPAVPEPVPAAPPEPTFTTQPPRTPLQFPVVPPVPEFTYPTVPSFP